MSLISSPIYYNNLCFLHESSHKVDELREYVIMIWAMTYNLDPHFINHFIRADDIHILGDTMNYTYLLEIDDDIVFTAQITSVVTHLEKPSPRDGLCKLFVEMHFDACILDHANNNNEIIQLCQTQIENMISTLDKGFEHENLKTLAHYKSNHSSVPFILYENIYHTQWSQMMKWCATI